MSDYIERYWRDATPEDAIAEPPMVARFRDHSEIKWTEVPLQLMGLCRASCAWFDTDGDTFDYCQVYDAPDPGEGWRLIDIESTTRLPSDEQWYPSLSKWLSPDDCYCDRYQDGCFYRRRIEPPKPKPKYEPFRWEDREQLRGRWVTWKHEDGTPIETPVTYLVKKESGELLINSRNSKWFLQNASFLDTGEPVGRKVQ